LQEGKEARSGADYLGKAIAPTGLLSEFLSHRKEILMSVKEIHTHDYTRGTVRYTIHVEEGQGGEMWGTWNCHDCNVGGSAQKLNKTIDDAVEAAKSDLDRHHISNHEI
jgi:hypothetical protein